MERDDRSNWGSRPRRSRSKMVSFRVSVDELEDLKVEAARLRVTISDVMRLALETLLGKRGPGGDGAN